MKKIVNESSNLEIMKVLKSKRTFWILTVLLLIAVGILGQRFIVAKRAAKFVFINETSDHRFDDSIRVSIFAAMKATGVQHAVLISDRELENESIETAAARVFQELELGRSNSGRAILYYFMPEKKSLRIEVGYALEGELPDIVVHGLELAAKSFIYTDRYQDFWAELIHTINIVIGDKQSESKDLGTPFDFTKFQFLSGGAGVSSYSYASSWSQLKMELNEIDGPAHRNLRAQDTVEQSLAVYLTSLKEGIGNSNLDVLTSESRFYRHRNVQTNFQLYRNWQMYEKAGVDVIIMAEPLAFVFFKEDNPVLPIVLRHEDNSWRVHEPLSWSLFQRFEDSKRVFLKYPISQLPSELQAYFDKRMGLPLMTLASPLTLQFLAEAPAVENIQSSLIHLYWLQKIEKTLADMSLESLSTDQLNFAADAYTNLGQPRKFLQAYRIIAERSPANSKIRKNLSFFEEVYQFKDSEWRLSR
jgi:hypothetical protein